MHRPGQTLLGAVVEIVEHHVHRAEVGGVGVHQDRLAGDRQGVGDARQLAGRSPRRVPSPSAVRSSDDESGSWTFDQQVALVLRWDEAGRESWSKPQ